MTTFSKYFKLGKTQPELDFVDINPYQDLPLFIDPFALSIKNDEWSLKCNQYIVSFFQTALDHIHFNRKKEAKELLNNLSEPNETCLGLSTQIPQGRGVSGKQALDLYDKLTESQAAKSGLLSELAECDLFVEGIGQDKISDITTNIIRHLLVEYTQKQCDLHNLNLRGSVASGRLWDPYTGKWFQDYVQLPIIDDKKVILVPKSIVRFQLCLNNSQYYNYFVLNFLQEEHLRANSSLVTLLKNGGRKVYKKTLKAEYPFSKEFLAQFTKEHPEVLHHYKQFLRNDPKTIETLNHDQLEVDEDFNEDIFANSMAETLRNIAAGNQTASKYHSFIIGALEFIFWPNLIYPKKEHKIHEGRKRIDITYTNAAIDGFFFRIHKTHNIYSNLIMVECKNYNKEVNNPELDQLAGRFSINRGKLGLLLYRETANYEELLIRCKDTASDGRGFIIPLGDKQLFDLLELIEKKQRNKIDAYLNNILVRILS